MNSEKNRLTFAISLISLINSAIIIIFYIVFFSLRYIMRSTQNIEIMRSAANAYFCLEGPSLVLYYFGRFAIPFGISATVICLTVLSEMCGRKNFKPIKDNLIAVFSLPVQLPACLFILCYYNEMW